MTTKGAINPYTYRTFSNNPEQMFNYTMTNLMDNMYNSQMDSSTDGTFKAICLSGIDSEDNNNQELNNVYTGGANYSNIIIRPLASFGDILPDPTKLTDANEIRNVIDLYASTFLARADFVEDNFGVQYGQILNCYFESGKISNSDFSGLRYSKPIKTELDPNYVKVSTVVSMDSKMQNLNWTNAQLIDVPTGVIDPLFPPQELIYIGKNENYKNKKLQNGNYPQDLLEKSKKGKKYLPTILKEIVYTYDNLVAAFEKEFPGKTLGAFGWRSYKEQLSLKKVKPKLAAKPGTSNHGWGLAVDMHYHIIDDKTNSAKSFSYSGKEYKWLMENAGYYGWYNPGWAVQGGTKEEPWHWESVLKNHIISHLPKEKDPSYYLKALKQFNDKQAEPSVLTAEEYFKQFQK